MAFLPTLNDLKKKLLVSPLGRHQARVVFSYGGPALVEKLLKLFCAMWTQEELPQEYKDPSITLPLLGKSLQEAWLQATYPLRGRNPGSPLPSPWQTTQLPPGNSVGLQARYGHCWQEATQEKCREQNRGLYITFVDLTKAFDTINRVGLQARYGHCWQEATQEKCREQNRGLYITFVDLTKAFDTINRDGLWKIMYKFECPENVNNIVRLFHDGTDNFRSRFQSQKG